MKASNKRKFGVYFAMQSDVGKEKHKKSCRETYGVDNYAQSEEFKAKWKDPKYVEQVQKKRCEAKRKNGTFSTSKLEEVVYDLLCKQFSKDDVIRQYSSKKYPFNCDFYIKSLDLYIECNFHWTHGGHFFDENNEEDQKTLQKWKDNGTQFFLNAIETWTKRDVLKLKAAIENKLNYFVAWKIDDIISVKSMLS